MSFLLINDGEEQCMPMNPTNPGDGPADMLVVDPVNCYRCHIVNLNLHPHLNPEMLKELICGSLKFEGMIWHVLNSC